MNERGYSILSGIDVSSIQAAQREIVKHMQNIGQPICYFDQPMVMDIKPQPGFQPASSGGQGYFDLHTDLSFHHQPPKYLGTLCITADEQGGDSILADGKKILEKFPDPKSRLRDIPVTFPTPSHIESGPVTQSILTGSPEDPVIHFRSDLIDSDDPVVRELVSIFSDLARKIMMTIKLQPGQLLLCDNHRMLHGRTEITAHPSRRHLLRAYANRSPLTATHT